MEQALNSLPRFGTEIKASLSVPSFFDNFDVQAGTLKNQALQQQLQQAVNSLTS